MRIVVCRARYTRDPWQYPRASCWAYCWIRDSLGFRIGMEGPPLGAVLLEVSRGSILD